MRKLVVVGLILFTLLAWLAYHLHGRYFNQNGELAIYTTLLDCASAELSLAKRLRYLGPVSPTLACYLRDQNIEDMGAGTMYISKDWPANLEKGTATETLIEIGRAACIDLRETPDELTDYLAMNIGVLDWLVKNFDHGEHSEIAREIVAQRHLSSEPQTRCRKYYQKAE